MTAAGPVSRMHAFVLERPVLTVVCVVALLRVIHLAFALGSPLSFQIGPDEDYYLRFAQDVAHGSGGLVPEFTFMDPLYGYLLGALLWLPGGSAASMYVVQIVVDCSTAVGLLMVGRALDRPGTGLVAALLYALLGPAMAFTTALLKTTWVTAYLCWWMVLALRAIAVGGLGRWAWFGLYCGLGVALRANLMLMVPLALLLPWLVLPLGQPLRTRLPREAAAAACFLAALALPLSLLLARNLHVDDRAAVVPTNGGVVIHQLYHPENPRSLSPGLPAFVAYAHPSEIWRGYRDEANRRAGHELDATTRDAYWRAEGMRYLLAHPLQDVRNGLRKLADFTAYTEVPNNRSFADERRFSPLLRWLPQPFGWLFALGVPGLVLLARRDRRSWVLLAPLAMGLFTIGVFFAEDRFRFNIVTPFVFGSAAWLAWLAGHLRTRTWRPFVLGLCASAVLGAWSILQAARLPEFAVDWPRMATGYFKQGDRAGLVALLREVEAKDPRALGLDEFKGLLALGDRDYVAARAHYERALTLRQNRHEVWHNYATALAHTGDVEGALAAEATAHHGHPTAEYAFSIAGYLERLGRTDEALEVYRAIAAGGEAPWNGRAAERLSALGH